jgi:hypothetical protein
MVSTSPLPVNTAELGQLLSLIACQARWLLDQTRTPASMPRGGKRVTAHRSRLLM